jgi:hypothetical protein
LSDIEDVVTNLDIERRAKQRYDGGYPDAQTRAARYEKMHKFYAPPGGDQWPEDLGERPGKLHITMNIIRGFVDTEARLLSIVPRITIPPQNDDEEVRMRGEATEKLFQRYLNQSQFEQWFYTLNQTKGLYGLGVLKAFWNAETKMPDAIVVEQPQNLMLGWGDSDYNTIDWAIYHYEISPLQARIRYPDIPKAWLERQQKRDTRMSDTGGGDHYDPLRQLSWSSGSRVQTQYEREMVNVWDYWYLDSDGTVMNAIMVNGHIVEGPFSHPEMPILPYIPVEHDHEPGSPDGRGTAELLLDIQMGLNRAMSHYAQHVWDTTDPAYQLTGPDAPMTVPPGLVPKSGELVAPGANTRIEEIRSGVNNFPFDALIQNYWNAAFRVTGLSEVLFGSSPGAQSSARALAVQLESSINRLDPKRKRVYLGLETLLRFWHFMVAAKNPKIDGIPAKEVIAGLNRWKIVAPEITPRDVIEHTQNVINKVNGKLVSLETAMDEVGVDNPMQEIQRIMAERSNANLFPGDAQAIAAVTATLQAIGAQQQAMSAAAQGTAEQDGAMRDAQEAQPQAVGEDQNQPATGAGSPPPGGASSPLGGELQPLVRESGGESSPMSQLVLPRREF